MYLRCITGDRPRAWVDWLSWAEYCYNTSYHSALRTTPFKVVYGRDPLALVPYQQGTASCQPIDEMLWERDIFLSEVRERLLQAQEHARRFYDAHHRDLELSVGNWVWLRLLHHQARSLVDRPKGKLGPRYAGPFKLLASARIHDVFHVGLLKPFRGTLSAVPPGLPAMENGRLLPALEKVLRARLRRGVWHV
ncbi:hypothetical protein BS78_K310000 [Paspalum vaginatum]|uniref:Integrase catalytic domain-containing protein n=1 Tax=Paspalum vaginatum TaxID=158149 RepID=A0A9W7X9N3_9POAL|nr:hypothetical protein BS78_K310000 [Paspalum vaginatum]